MSRRQEEKGRKRRTTTESAARDHWISGTTTTTARRPLRPDSQRVPLGRTRKPDDQHDYHGWAECGQQRSKGRCRCCIVRTERDDGERSSERRKKEERKGGQQSRKRTKQVGKSTYVWVNESTRRGWVNGSTRRGSSESKSPKTAGYRSEGCTSQRGMHG